jgi:hypothetical protein
MKKLVARLQRRALRENRLDDANIKVIRQRLETYTSAKPAPCSNSTGRNWCGALIRRKRRSMFCAEILGAAKSGPTHPLMPVRLVFSWEPRNWPAPA